MVMGLQDWEGTGILRSSLPLFGSAQNFNISYVSCGPALSYPSALQTSVFTPAYGSVTNVRVNSTMTTQQVLTLLLNKFRVSVTSGSSLAKRLVLG